MGELKIAMPVLMLAGLGFLAGCAGKSAPPASSAAPAAAPAAPATAPAPSGNAPQGGGLKLDENPDGGGVKNP